MRRSIVAAIALLAMTSTSFAACREFVTVTPDTVIPGELGIIDGGTETVDVLGTEKYVQSYGSAGQAPAHTPGFTPQRCEDAAPGAAILRKGAFCDLAMNQRSLSDPGAGAIYGVRTVVVGQNVVDLPDTEIQHPDTIVDVPDIVEHQNGVYFNIPHGGTIWVGFGPIKDGGCNN